MSTLLSLHAGPGTSLPKPAVAKARLVEGMGVEGDRHFGKHPDRAVLVAGRPAYERAARAGIELPWGALGENLLIDLDPHELDPGSRLQIGAVLLELADVCTVCSSLSAFDLRLPKVLLGKRGLYARVLRGGVVEVGDRIEVQSPRSTPGAFFE